MTTLVDTPEWHALLDQQKILAQQHMQDLFSNDPTRFNCFSLNVQDIFLDYSKNRINKETFDLLCQLAHKANLPKKIQELFNGLPLNSSEKKPALHTALRNRTNKPIYVDNHDIMPEINSALDKMGMLVEKIRSKQWLGVTGKPIRDIVNIGIGGSYLGARMATHALSDYAHPELGCHFISNIDSYHIQEVLKQINPATTLFIVSSKSFTTLETLTNAKTIRAWLQQQLGTTNLQQHFIAVTAAKEKALQFGIHAENILPVWDWVGGRFSVWSPVGLPLAIMIGMQAFAEFLAGAHAMDMHFCSANFSENMPVILALLGIWYINFFATTSHAIIPYSHLLNHFQEHLQQADMESNGKRITHGGTIAAHATGPIIWGEQGCNGQHAFHQLLHQGHHLVPVDFILVGKSAEIFQKHQDILVASGLSQAQALMQGKTVQQAFAELVAEGHSKEAAELLANHKSIPGNRPSNTLFIKKISPYNLGALLALYEHKIFVQGVIWDINSFDQWGVELGKQLLPRILTALNDNNTTDQDSSTLGLIHYYKKLQESPA